MTNKQITIDGIDVSGCIHRATNKMGNDIGTYCRCFTESCKNIKNCHYKQLKRAEQECERLKRQYNCYACDTCKGKEDYINLKRHCENAIKSLHNKQAEFDQLKAENEELKRQLKVKGNILKLTNEAKNEYLDENKKLKQFLQSYISDYKKMYEANTTF